MSVTKVDDVDPVTAGETLTYTVTVSNAGPSDAASVVVTDTLPAGVSFVSATPDQGSCAEAAGVVTCALGTIADGGSINVVIVTDVPATAAPGSLTNNVAVSSTTAVPVAANDSASEDTTVITSADLSVTKSDDVDPVTAGETLTYTCLLYTSPSPRDA